MFIPKVEPGMILVCIPVVEEERLTHLFMCSLPIIHFQTMRVKRLILRGTDTKEEEGAIYIFGGLSKNDIEQFRQKIQEKLNGAWVITDEDFKVHASQFETQPPEVHLIFYL